MKTGFQISAIALLFLSLNTFANTPILEPGNGPTGQDVVKNNWISCHSIDGAGSLYSFKQVSKEDLVGQGLLQPGQYQESIFKKLAESPAHVGKVLTVTERNALQTWLDDQGRAPASLSRPERK